MSSPSSTLLDVELQAGKPPLLRTQNVGNAAGWALEHGDALRATVAEYGAVLVRGLGLDDAGQVGEVFRRLAPSGLMVDREGFAHRERYADGVYSSVKWPANQPMCMHHELSYADEVPGLMLFACLEAPTAGGATGVADGRTVLGALPTDLVERFERDGWVLSRSFNEDIGASYQDAFGVAGPTEAESYCRAHGIDFVWQPDGELRTRQRRPAVVRHPLTGQRCWFNQVAFLNEWTMAPEVREYLVDVYGPDGLPFNTRFGDDGPIGEAVISLLNEVYEAHTAREAWQVGDLMLVDNVRMAHSREAYQGPRAVLVGMAEPVHASRLATGIQGSTR